MACWITALLLLWAVYLPCARSLYAAEAKASRSLPPTLRTGFGAIFVAHHENEDMNTHFLKLAVLSARSYRVRAQECAASTRRRGDARRR